MEITQVIHATLERNAALDLLPLIRWEWNTRLTSTMGRYNTRTHLIDFSTVLWSRATEAEREQVVAHEVCHLIVRNRYPGASAHGWEWKRTMLTAGYQPDRCHKVKVDKRKRRPTARVQMYCGCPEGIQVTQNLFTRMRNKGEFDVNGVNHYRRCRKCKRSIRARKEAKPNGLENLKW